MSLKESPDAFDESGKPVRKAAHRFGSKTESSFLVRINKFVDAQGDDGKKKKKKDKGKGKEIEGDESPITPSATTPLTATIGFPPSGSTTSVAGLATGSTAPAAPSSPLWPLIRVVRLRCRSPALSTGAVLVDLPGIADANLARGQISRSYLAKADKVWIVTPIQRAVDDGSARELLGDQFKMQMHLDGRLDDSALTFIATKTDDVSFGDLE
jgi:hypothetical protein